MHLRSCARTVWLLALLFVVAQPGIFAQGPPATPPGAVVSRRDPQALQIISDSLAAMGAVPGAFQHAILSGRMVPAGGIPAKTFQTTYEIRGRRVAFLRQIASAAGTDTFASGNGKPLRLSANGKSYRFSDHVALAAQPFELPFVILAAALRDPAYSAVLVDSAPGAPLHIKIEDETDVVSQAVTGQDWYFDPATKLPTRVEYRLPDVIDAAKSEPASCDYVAFQAVNGMSLPKQLHVVEPGGTAEMFIDSVDFNAAVAADFDMPAGGLQ
jgi:hypothetical protein